MTDHLTLASLTQVVMSGIALGSIYAVVGLGLTLVFGVMRVINMAHGEFLMLGAFLTYFMFSLVGVNPVLALPLSVTALFLLGALTHRCIVFRVVGMPELPSMVLTFGVSLTIVGVALAAFTNDYRSVPYLTSAVEFAGIRMSTTRILAFLMAMVLSVGFYMFLRFTRMGQAIRATSQVQDMAKVCGINVGRVYIISFGLGAALAAAGGSLLTMIYAIFPEMGLVFTIKAFMIVILGGCGNFAGAFLAGMLLGIAETVGGLLLTTQAVELIAFVLLILTLLIRPTGLFFGERD